MKKLAIIFVLLFNHTLLLAQPLKVITHDFPPFSYTREGKLQGLSVEMLNAVLTKMKFTDYQIVTLPWKRALKEGQKPGNLLFPFARKPSREPNFEWVGKAGPRKISLFKLATRVDIPELAQNSDYRDYAVVSLNGTAYSRALIEQGFNALQHSNTPLQGISILAHERADLVLEDEAVFYHSVRQYNATASHAKRADVAKVTDFSTPSDRWFGFGKGSDAALVARFIAAYQALQQDGTLARITQRYFE